MGSANWLGLVAKQHDEWVDIVKSFGETRYAEDIVQEAYIALYKYAVPENVMEDGRIRRGYMFFTLRSLYYQFYNKRKKVNKISLDSEENFLQLPDESNLAEQEAFHKICTMIDEQMEDWNWYNRKLFKLYRDTDLSIRKIASETHISWVSIFNTLKNCKEEIRKNLSEHYEDYKNGDFERI